MKNSKQTTFSEGDMIAAVYGYLECMCNNMYTILNKFRSDIAKPEDKEDVAIAQGLLQMAICRTQSLLKLSKGICIVPNREEPVLLEPISMIPILRSLYELVFIFRNIFIMTDTEEERLILLNIWKIRGFNNRQKEKVSPRDLKIPNVYLEKQEKEFKDIEEMRQKIESILSTMDITESAKATIGKTIKSTSSSIKGYKFEKLGSCITSFSTISLTSSPQHIYNNPQLNAVYTFLSMHTHPSYISALQFGQMFNNEHYKKIMRTVLMSACVLNSHLIQDFCKFIPECQKYYEQMEGTDIDEELRKQ